MMKPLRKKHLFIWRLLALLLPAGIIGAWLSVPTQVPQLLIQPPAAKVLPLILAKMDNAQCAVAIRSNADTSDLQLEWINKTVLQYPTATIYAAAKEINDIREAKLIGRIESRGNWYFPLDSTFKPAANTRLILYDFIHQQIIDTIKLSR